MTRLFLAPRGIAVGLLISAAAFGCAQEIPFRLIQETYFETGSQMRGLQHTADWTELRVNFNDQFSGVFSNFHYSSDGMLDEDYLSLDKNNYSLRAGRMRSAFGFGCWSDLWYNPVISRPICRFMPLADGINLSNLTSGAEAKVWNGPVQGEFAILNPNPSEEQVFSKDLSFDRARLQVSKGGLIAGFNAIARNGNLSSTSSHALGVDYRWTTDRVIIRGEAMRGYGLGANGHGAYTDLTYRPPKFFRTQIGGRVEDFEMPGVKANLYTAGIRQILTPNLALTLNYSWGSVPNFLYSLQGWHLETSFGVRFQ